MNSRQSNPLRASEMEDLKKIDIALKNSAKNMPCLCGSGQKFKKCCRPKLQAEREKYRKTHGV